MHTKDQINEFRRMNFKNILCMYTNNIHNVWLFQKVKLIIDPKRIDNLYLPC